MSKAQDLLNLLEEYTFKRVSKFKWGMYDGDDLLAMDNDPGKTPKGFSVYTVYLKFKGDDATEEIDIAAKSKDHVKALATHMLKNDYDAGGKIARVEGPRQGLYM